MTDCWDILFTAPCDLYFMQKQKNKYLYAKYLIFGFSSLS